MASGKLEIRESHVEEINRKSDALYQLIKHLLNSGVRVDAVGLQCHLNVNRSYDWENVKKNIQRFKDLGVEVYITELDVSMGWEWKKGGPFPKDYEKLQAERYYGMVKAAREAGMHRIDFWGLSEAYNKHWLAGQNARLVDEQFQPRPIYQAVLKALYDTQLTKASSLLSADPLYTQEGNDPSFGDVLKGSGGKAGERFNKGGALGSRIHVNHALLEQQVGKIGPIPKDIGLHTEFSGGINRKEFAKWTRWYQEDGNVQVFRLFKGEQNIRGGGEQDGSPGRVEVFAKPLAVTAGTWHEYEATYTIIKPVGACIFQLFHDGKDKAGHALLWPLHLDMTAQGEIHVLRRRPESDAEKKVTLAENLVGKSLSVKVRANGEDWEVYQKDPLDQGPWKLVTKGSYTKAQGKISFRWGMYCGSKKGQSVPNDALLFVTGVKIR